MADPQKDKDKGDESLSLSNQPKAGGSPGGPKPQETTQPQSATTTTRGESRQQRQAEADAQAESEPDTDANAPRATYRTPTNRYLTDKRKDRFGDEPGTVRLDTAAENDPNAKMELVFIDADGEEVGREEYDPDDEPEQSGIIAQGVARAETQDKTRKNR